jgi:hypothetical protein
MCITVLRLFKLQKSQLHNTELQISWKKKMLDFYSFWHNLKLICYFLQLITFITYTPAARRIWMPMTAASSIYSACYPLLLPSALNVMPEHLPLHCHHWAPMPLFCGKANTNS